MASPKTRRTRIVCISDTHNHAFGLPKGDVLIHAGDITNQGSYSELSKAIKWLEDADFQAKIVVAGNHDITLDAEFYTKHGHLFHNQVSQNPASCLALVASSPSVTYLAHEATTIRLQSPTGPRTEFTVFGSPYSPRHGVWAFHYDSPNGPSSADADLTALWERIPLQADIVVTHTPPRTHRDDADDGERTGCEALRRALWRVRPKLAVCGHIHDGRGAERVTWDLHEPNVAYAEKGTILWTDAGEGNKKLSLIDLTGKHSRPLDNDGTDPSRTRTSTAPSSEHHDLAQSSPSPASPSSAGDTLEPGSRTEAGREVACKGHGLAGDPNAAPWDCEALVGRMGRKETCVVNAAIMKSSYPHAGGKKFHKPIVVDVDLPVWEQASTDDVA
ncbi:putative rhamnogalacturonate lyase C [Drechmeria coniospora]|uniref:Putative rhamnogalacturonate lyase C n=1 Tax=Drechmeria coniospora TaxID=98403 RepID=A0A151GJ22_DRECN|nr:putative rhamnogalacturonate lyase C [Drechmeria coniospora]KYK57086.1 putative rhamnogalacturonate lyase C [Drechmeria coniospora]ODA78988.1 hypothetical protein RJ55_04578 [Drechmeria coniospora]